MTEEQRLLTKIESQQCPFSSHMLPNKEKPEERIHSGPLHTNKFTCFLLPGGLYKQGDWNLPWPLSFPVSKSLIKSYPCISPAKPSIAATTEQGGEMVFHPERTRSNQAKGVVPIGTFQNTRASCDSWNFSREQEPCVLHTPLGSSLFPNPLLTHELTGTQKSYLSKSFPGGNWQFL